MIKCDKEGENRWHVVALLHIWPIHFTNLRSTDLSNIFLPGAHRNWVCFLALWLWPSTKKGPRPLLSRLLLTICFLCGQKVQVIDDDFVLCSPFFHCQWPLSSANLQKMQCIHDKHPLFEQGFWIHCHNNSFFILKGQKCLNFAKKTPSKELISHRY